MNKRVFVFILILFTCCFIYHVHAVEYIDLPAVKFNSDTSTVNGLTGKYREIVNQIINIAFVIAGVPVVWQLATGSPKAKKSIISYLAAMGIYYGVLQGII